MHGVKDVIRVDHFCLRGTTKELEGIRFDGFDLEIAESEKVSSSIACDDACSTSWGVVS